ncbi:hypothetical protein ACSDR0_01380 [Streptosporangium sp. G11]|uniref:hypothetical protein n=1 Tax=Streptosporangium sp. G11 TaxID=3436926 RepID=UPI003EB78A26
MATLNVFPTDQVKERDRRLAESPMTTWAGAEPTGGRDGDPVAALAGSGVHGREEAPGSRTGPVECAVLEDLVIEDLDHPAPVVAAWTYCG